MPFVQRLKFSLPSVLLCLGSFTCLPSDAPAPAFSDSHITREIQAVWQAFPSMDVVLLTNDDRRPQQLAKIGRFFREHDISAEDFDDSELRYLADVHAQVRHLDEAAWPIDGKQREPMCVVTLNKVDYRVAGPRYWETAWSIPDGIIDMKVDPEVIGNWDIDHELFHCLARPLHLEHPSQLQSATEQVLYDEASADVYAGLMHIRQSNSRQLINIIARIRQILVKHDREHYTREALDYVYGHPDQYNQAALQQQSPVQLAYMANRIVNQQWPLLREKLYQSYRPGAGKKIQACGYRQLVQIASAERKSRGYTMLAAVRKIFARS